VDAIAAITAVTLLVDLLGGVMVGMFTSVSVASLYEDRKYSLTGAAPGLLSAGARAFHGISVNGGGFISDALRGDATPQHHGDNDVPGENSDQNKQGQEPDP
jgi:hypothetical protein